MKATTKNKFESEREFIDRVFGTAGGEYVTAEEIGVGWDLPVQFVRRLVNNTLGREDAGIVRCPRDCGHYEDALRVSVEAFRRFREAINNRHKPGIDIKMYPEVLPPAKARAASSAHS